MIRRTIASVLEVLELLAPVAEHLSAAGEMYNLEETRYADTMAEWSL